LLLSGLKRALALSEQGLCNGMGGVSRVHGLVGLGMKKSRFLRLSLLFPVIYAGVGLFIPPLTLLSIGFFMFGSIPYLIYCIIFLIASRGQPAIVLYKRLLWAPVAVGILVALELTLAAIMGRAFKWSDFSIVAIYAAFTLTVGYVIVGVSYGLMRWLLYLGWVEKR